MNHSIAEKYPFLFDRLLWIREYGWRFGYTSAQIDLMIADRPVTDYKTDRRSKGSLIATKGEVDELDNLVEEWSKKRNGRTFVGEKFSLDGFLGGKINNKK